MASNFLSSAVAAAATATVFSPQARKILRSGAVRGLAGVLVAGDALSSFARGVGRGLQETGAGSQAGPSASPSPAEAAQDAARAAEEAARAAQEAADAAQGTTAAKRTKRSRKSTSKADVPAQPSEGAAE